MNCEGNSMAPYGNRVEIDHMDWRFVMPLMTHLCIHARFLAMTLDVDEWEPIETTMMNRRAMDYYRRAGIPDPEAHFSELVDGGFLSAEGVDPEEGDLVYRFTMPEHIFNQFGLRPAGAWKSSPAS